MDILIGFDYAPKKDITAYELAVIIPILISGILTKQAYSKLGNAKRHFIIDGHR
ncbi:MAG: hypothetical protein GXP60_05165 [Epsilonproteobacteria bacterium]|nr:hypothetical protein [Campylobacterota bacterium]